MQGILVVAAVFWALMCRLATAALHEDTSAARHPADSKAKRLRGDPEGHSDLPMRNERLVRLHALASHSHAVWTARGLTPKACEVDVAAALRLC